MKFQYKFYPFQQDILDTFESEIQRGDKKIHIVAPPGSGKTIVGIEMMHRLRKRYGGKILVFSPNITIQLQWKDKIESLFLGPQDDIDTLVSLRRDEIAPINILTYQGISGISSDTDEIYDMILEKWYSDFRDEFENREIFKQYVENLKENDSKEYEKHISKYKKTLKLGNTKSLLNTQVTSYLEKLKKEKITALVVDEAHHLTAWWSKVLSYFWKELGEPFIIGLTATPPFQNIDYFALDNSYTSLLGEVDYYIPTPAIIKSGRLAPYNNLVYFTKPEETTLKIIEKNQQRLEVFLDTYQNDIGKYLYNFVSKKYDILLKNNGKSLTSYLRFLHHKTSLDINKYVYGDEIFETLSLEDISRSVGKYFVKQFTKHSLSPEEQKTFEDIKNIFYHLGYIWRGNGLYRFRTAIEMALIYSKSKVGAMKTILTREGEYMGEELKCAIITDFLEENGRNHLNAKYILQEISTTFPEYSPVLVSGQGVWEYRDDAFIALDIDILQATEELTSGKRKIIIGTRGILGEGWDCPSLNTLIDVTGVSAFMSVNQIRGRAIRLDKNHPKKLANVYDIVALGGGYDSNIDFERLEKKFENFYGVDGSGLIVKGVNHMYPDLVNHLHEATKINTNMLKRIPMREYFYKLWNIGSRYKNKEVFGLHLEILGGHIYTPFVYMGIRGRQKLKNITGFKNINLEDIDSGERGVIFQKFLTHIIRGFIYATSQANITPKGMNVEIKRSGNGMFKIISNYHDEYASKVFLDLLSEVFSPIINQKFLLTLPMYEKTSTQLKQGLVYFGVPYQFARNKTIRKDFLQYVSKKTYLYSGVLSPTFAKRGFIGLSHNMLHQLFMLNLKWLLPAPVLEKWSPEHPQYALLRGNRPIISSKLEKIWI